MPKLTLLEIVQDILNDMDSDEVNSIDDTIEAQQVAQIVKTTYYNIIDNKDWPHLYQLFQLSPSGIVSKPTMMRIPESYTKVLWVKYNKRKSTDTKDNFAEVKYKEPADFIEHCNYRDSSASNVQAVIDAESGISLLVLEDVAPTYWTSFDDDYIYFDSYDSAVDTTLQNSKVQAYGIKQPTFSLVDSFIPDLPVQAFSYLLNESKSVAFMALKQTPNNKAEQHSITQRRRLSQEKWKVNGGIKVPNYGRK